MLVRSRAARSAAGCAAILLAAITAMASASPAAAARRAYRVPGITAGRAAPTDFPPGAADKLDNDLRKAWQITQGSGVLIAVISTGITSVSGLSGKVTGGLDLAPMDNPDNTIGTVLASAIAGSGPTGTSPWGPIGRAPAARILSVRVFDTATSGTALQFWQDGTWQSNLAKGIRYSADHGANVIVTIPSGSTDSPDLAAAVAYAISKNIPVVTAGDYSSGNGSNTALFPDDLPGVISAKGVVLSGQPSPPRIQHTGPTEFALVTEPQNELQATCPGDLPCTVFDAYAAVAWLAGTVALIRSVYPTIPPWLIARALGLSASYAPAGGYNTQVGFGLINPIGALTESAKLVKSVPASGPLAGAVAPAANFGSGAPPGVIDAVHHSTAKVAGYSGSIAAGVALLAVAFWLWRRGRRGRRALAVAIAPDLALASPPGVVPVLAPDQLAVPVQEAEATGDQGHGEHGEHGVLAEETGLPEVELGG